MATMKKFICPEALEYDPSEALNLEDAKDIFGCYVCDDCDSGPVEWKDEATKRADMDEAYSAKLAGIARDTKRSDFGRRGVTKLVLIDLLRRMNLEKTATELANME